MLPDGKSAMLSVSSSRTPGADEESWGCHQPLSRPAPAPAWWRFCGHVWPLQGDYITLVRLYDVIPHTNLIEFLPPPRVDMYTTLF